MPDIIKEYADNNGLFYFQYSDGLFIFCDEGYFYHLFYYVDPNGKLSPIEMDKPIIVKFVYSISRGIYPKDITDMVEKFTKIGYSFYKTLVRLSVMPASDIISGITGSEKLNKIEAVYADDYEVKDIMNIFDEGLDPFLHSQYDEKNILKQINDKKIYCIKDENGRILAALQTEIGNNCGSILHISVLSEYRDRGFGTILANAFFQSMLQKNIYRCMVWVDKENIRAQKFYGKLGFIPDNKASDYYILK